MVKPINIGARVVAATFIFVSLTLLAVTGSSVWDRLPMTDEIVTVNQPFVPKPMPKGPQERCEEVTDKPVTYTYEYGYLLCIPLENLK
jgi:hypothetical protein